ncbi:MAG: hypothetical protein LBH06_02885 [Rikenellaceae bacterium]|jgi:predicted nucleic acid-binding protein|nr:hypothetical protein [Rikenellaceae bacterium]
MKTGFEFDQVGKRLPYSVPEGFFEASAERALGRVARERRRRMTLRTFSSVMVAAAAVATGVFFVTHGSRPALPEYGAAIDRIVVNLSDEELQTLESDLSSDYFLTDNLY